MDVLPDILKKLVCSVCGEYLSCAPVRMKHDGSVLCGRCCAPDGEVTLRLTPYENLAEMMVFPCANKTHGCPDTCYMSEMTEHERECKYRQRGCPVTGPCGWSGALKDIPDHCQAQHADNLSSVQTSPATIQQQTHTTAEASDDSLPAKSKAIYEKVFKTFVEWKMENGVTAVNEKVMMTYFHELSAKYTPNSMWSKYSILKSTLLVNDTVDISRYKRLVAFLKQRSKGYVPKTSKVLTGNQVLMFLKNARNETHLLHKVVLVMGVFGGLKRDEMVRMTIDHVEDRGRVLFVNVPETRTGKPKGFTIMEEREIGALGLVREYIALRPPGLAERRFFLTYRSGKCTAQPVGKNTLGSVPSVIAKYLKLESAHAYTGHCLRRTSSTLLVEAFETLKKHGQWKRPAGEGEDG